MIFDLQHTKSALASIYVSNIPGQDNELYANQILKIGDQMERTTNVKADMTHWATFLPEWKLLCKNVMENHLREFIEPYLMNEARFVCHALWGVSYSKGDHTVFHDHFPSLLSFIYYVKADEDSAPLVFTDIDYELHPKENDLIIFPSYLKHSVPVNRDKEMRYSMAFNTFCSSVLGEEQNLTYVNIKEDCEKDIVEQNL